MDVPVLVSAEREAMVSACHIPLYVDSGATANAMPSPDIVQVQCMIQFPYFIISQLSVGSYRKCQACCRRACSAPVYTRASSSAHYGHTNASATYDSIASGFHEIHVL